VEGFKKQEEESDGLRKRVTGNSWGGGGSANPTEGQLLHVSREGRGGRRLQVTKVMGGRRREFESRERAGVFEGKSEVVGLRTQCLGQLLLPRRKRRRRGDS